MSGREGLLTMGEACHYVGVSRMTLLAAESAGIVQPGRTPGGHRRYSARDLDRLLAGRTPARGSHADVPRTPPTAPPHGPDPGTQEAVRQLVLLLKADSAVLYELAERCPRLTASFGVPRWLVEQLERAAPPEPVLSTLASGRDRVFDPREALPRHAANGQGLALPVRGGGGVTAVLLVVGRDRTFLGAEVDIGRTAATYVGLLLEQQQRLHALSARLREVHRLSDRDDAA